MRAVRSLSTRLGVAGATVALAAAGLVGAAGIVATAGPAAASTPIGTTTCALGATAGNVPITASVSAAISPNPVPAGDNFTLKDLSLSTTLIAGATTSEAAGLTLSVTYTTNLLATGATPASQTVTFSGSVTLPNPFPVGASQPFTMTGSTGAFTSDAAGATSTSVSINPAGSLAVSLTGIPPFSGPCTGPPPVVIASAPITPAPAFVSAVVPNAGSILGGSTVKLVGSHFLGTTAVDFGTHPAASFRIVSPSVIEAVVPATTISGNTVQTDNILVTTAAGQSKAQPNDAFTYVDTSLGAIVSGVTPNIGTASGGTTVTITGAGFAGGNGDNGCSLGNAITSVDFGSTPAVSFDALSDSVMTAVVPAGSGIVPVTVVGCDESTPSPLSPADLYNYNPGYILAGSDGGVFSYGQVPGNAGFFGSAGNLTLNKPVVGIARTPSGNGYWLAAADGGIFSYGGAQFFGSAGNLTLNAPVVGVASTPDGAGYWEVAADGGVFTYGDAGFYGSAGNLHLAAPVVGMASTPDGKGYWLVAADGGVFAYGDAGFYGSTGNLPLAAPVVGITAAPGARATGWWAPTAASSPTATPRSTARSAAPPWLRRWSVSRPTGDGQGYWILTAGGAVFNKGDAGFFGDMAGFTLNGTMVGMSDVQSVLAPV